MEFEERADQLSNEEINRSLADGEILIRARQKLLASGAKFLIGPRGTGKTHLMRYTYTQALLDKTAPLVLYASFNRYLHLEPLLKKLLTRLSVSILGCWQSYSLAYSISQTILVQVRSFLRRSMSFMKKGSFVSS